MSDKTTEKRINDLLVRLNQDISPHSPQMSNTGSGGLPPTSRPNLPLNLNSSPVSRPRNLSFTTNVRNVNAEETERRLKEIMKISGDLRINGDLYKTDIKDMEDLEELGNGTCGHVVKMRHKLSDNIIAVKQMRRSGNTEENKRIIMDIEVVLKSHDCQYIVQCLGCFISESEVWICMELMDTCFDKLLKRFKHPVPENVLGKVTVATVEALSYLKDKHGVIHRDVKPSNILLDMKGNVKLCDFGISGRLVDSMAKTRQAGCAAYMAPERIEPDPKNPDYDVRADVWSLGITLVELATGVFPYQDCKTDFEMLTKVIEQEPPTLPADKEFSPEFRDFVKCCLIKDKKSRPKYAKLKNHSFIKKYAVTDVNVGEWYRLASEKADAAKKGAPRPNQTSNPIRNFFTSHTRQPSTTTASTFVQTTQTNLVNGGCPSIENTSHSCKTEATKLGDSAVRSSRLSAFQSSNLANSQRDHNVPHVYHQRNTIESPLLHQSQPNNRSYSPFQAYHNHLASLQQQQQQQNKTADGFSGSPILQRRLTDSPTSSPYQHRRLMNDGGSKWRSPSASPLPLRNQFAPDEQQYNQGNTSPIILQRFYHQQKQQQMAREAEESGKKRFTSFIKVQLSGDRSGRSSRHQSPEPPPRLNRTVSGENSPLALRRNFLESHAPNSPSLSRRYVSPTPPMPPPRRVSESNSVPGSPQHLRTRFHYTPEPQRRLFQNNDVS